MKSVLRLSYRLLPFHFLTIMAIAAVFFVACATQTGVVSVKEDHLRRGLTIDQVESILGTPLDKTAHKGETGTIAVRKYVSSNPSKIFQITYLNGRVDQITWLDTPEEAKQQQPDVSKRIEPGQSEERVKEIIGPPSHITGIGFEKIWWYYVSDDEIYLLKFRDHELVNGLKTSAEGLKDFLKQYRKF